MRRSLPILLLAVAATAVAACGDGEPETTRVGGDTLTVYASLPQHGLDAPAGAAAAAGMRLALTQAGGRAADRTVRLVLMPSTRRGDLTWDPGTVEANADRAAEDPTTIAYLGELDGGASAVSLPVTNGEQIVQVSPADALTSLTETPPGRPRAGPERYYPEERRTFVRLVPADVGAARRIVARLRRDGVRRVAIVSGDGIADRELEGMVLGLIGEGQPHTVTRVPAPGEDDTDPERVDELVEEVVDAEPEAVVYLAADGPRARAAEAALRGALPGKPVIAGPEPPSPRCARALGRRAMKLVLEAIDSAGPDRAAVVRAAKAARRVTPCR